MQNGTNIKDCYNVVLFVYLGQQIRKLVKDGLIIKKPVAVHSRARCRKNTLARRKGRHTGIGMYQSNVIRVPITGLKAGVIKQKNKMQHLLFCWCVVIAAFVRR